MDESDPEQPAKPERRTETDRLTRELQSWIDALDTPEPAPDLRDEALIEAVRQPAELDLVGALLGLKQEAGLQGRAFRDLTRELETLREASGSSTEALERALTEGNDRTRRELAAELGSMRKAVASARPDPVDPAALARSLEDARARGREETLADLLDVRDRLSRGLEDARRRLTGLRGLRALFSDRSVLEAVVDGLRISLDRLDDLLRRLEVREVPVMQAAFDPVTMQAIEVETRSDLPDGQVIEVLRPGYTRGARLIRPAEVRVNRRPKES